MTTELNVIDPRTAPEWDAFVKSHPEATVFHTSGWARVILDTYRYKPLYHVARGEGGTLRAAVPLMQVDGLLTHRRLVGLPFSDTCAPLLADGPEGCELMDQLKSAGEQHGAGHVQVRGRGGAATESAGFTAGTTFFQHIIPILPHAEEMEKRLHSSARRAIRKAEKEGITVRISTNPADMRHFYRLMVMTRKKHGLLPQPWRFFKNIQKYMMDTGAGYLLLAEHGGKPIAGDLLLKFRDQMVYKFNASDPRHLHLRPNNVLLWQAMRLSASLGCKTLDLGRCDEDNEGLRRFKLLWGSDETTLSYFSYALPGAPEGRMATSKPGRVVLGAFVRIAPLYALQAVGGVIYHNFG